MIININDQQKETTTFRKNLGDPHSGGMPKRTFYYNISLDILIPYFFGVKKFRERKLDLLIAIRLLKSKVNAVLSAFTKDS
jgi:hypothetical protein